MDEKIISLSTYNELFEKNTRNVIAEYVYYSFVSLEIEYLEALRKKVDTQISNMRDFCSLLGSIDAIQQIPLEANDIAEALNDEDFNKEYLGKQINPYRLSAITTIRHREYSWWSDDVYSQYREIYE